MNSRACILLVSLLASLPFLAGQSTNNAGTQTVIPAPPAHPITDEQLRTLFKVCHFESTNRELTHEKMEQQRAQLPPWYLQPVWNEFEEAVDHIDLAAVGLPVYQKYLGQDDAKWLVRFFASPQGQKLVQTVMTKDIQAQHSGATPTEAREQTLATLAGNEAEEVKKVMDGMSPADLRDLEAHSAYMQQMQPVLAQLRKEFSKAILDKQTDLLKNITSKHVSELAEAKRKYEAEHPTDSGSTTPQ